MTAEKITGATPQEWGTFIAAAGVSELVPIAIDGRPEDGSRLSPKMLGKVPSRYNAKGNIVGLHQWTQHIATSEDVDKWKQQAYNIGLILGRSKDDESPALMAIDVDVESETIQKALYAILTRFLKKDIPYRGRENSARRAYLVKAKSIGKTAIQLPKNEQGKQEAVELLCKGQQIAVAGRHPSGERYVWRANETSEEAYQLQAWDIPVLSEQQLIDLWKAIAVALEVPEVPLVKANPRTRDLSSSDVNATDEIADWLDANGKVIETDKHGTRYLYSFRDESEYSSEFKPGDIVYYPAGTGGYSEGAFKCLHATDAGMTKNDLLNAYGYTTAQFDDLTVNDKGGVIPLEKLLTDCQINKRTGKYVLDTRTNLRTALMCEKLTGYQVALDRFRMEMVIRKYPDGKFREFKSGDYTRLCEAVESIFDPVNFENAKRAIQLEFECDERSINTAMDVINAINHDGKKRVETFFSHYFNAEDTEYTRAVSLYTWSAMAGRVISPGAEVHMVPVLFGGQGEGKSRGIKEMALDPNQAVKISFKTKEIETYRNIRGTTVVEIDELDGLHTKEANTIKSFITASSDKYRPLFQEKPIDVPRTCLFIATTNNKEFLTDPTGNRRWLPMTTGEVNYKAIIRDRAQLWAEARDLFMAHGVMYHKAQELAKPEHENYRLEDPWEELIRCWLYSDSESPKPIEAPYLLAKDIAMFALCQDAGRFDGAKGRRLSGVMLSLGYERTRMSIDIEVNGVVKKVQTRVYVKKTKTA